MDGPNTRPTLLRRLSDTRERETAWQEFLELYGQPVYGVILRREVNKADAEVLLQEVLIKVWRSLASYEGRGPFRGWLHHVTLNCIRDYWKQKARDRASDIAALGKQLEQVANPHWEEDWQDRLY